MTIYIKHTKTNSKLQRLKSMKSDTVSIALLSQVSLTILLSKIMKLKTHFQNHKKKSIFFAKWHLAKLLKINLSIFRFQLRSLILDTSSLQNGGRYGVTTSILSLNLLMKYMNEEYFIIQKIFLRIKTFARI